MADKALNRQLAQLEAARYCFGNGEGRRAVQLLNRLDSLPFPDAASLIRFHEALLFMRAFPHGPGVVRTTERVLNRFHARVEALREAGVEMEAFDTFEFSGIAGTAMEDSLSFDVARWLVRRMPGEVAIAWENYDPGRELGTSGPRFIPLLEDDAYVEADTPWRKWLEAAAGKKKPAEWLIERFERLALPDEQKAALYESLRVPLRWSLDNSVIARTRNWKPARNIFYHRGPLISRSRVSLAEEFAKGPPRLRRLSRSEGEQILEMVREVMLVRYRELYGTTLGDARSVRQADLGVGEDGRGISIYLWNLPPERRLPLRAYVAGLTLKNGVPINYIEAIGLCEWMEVGFNTFYTFRGGETGWIYAQVLRCLCKFMGTTCVSVYPYQLGQDNDEAIESGAFWFYRKLGFRPGQPQLRQLAEREERKIAGNPKYRTTAKTLRRLASGHAFYELPGSNAGAWDSFSTRNIGLCVNRRMAKDFGGDSSRMREHSARALEKVLGVTTASWLPLEKATFSNFALMLTELEEISKWTEEEKVDLVTIIRSKSNSDEMLYLRLTQQHARLRNALRTLGS